MPLNSRGTLNSFGLDWEAAGRFKVIDVFGMSKYEQRQASVTC